MRKTPKLPQLNHVTITQNSFNFNATSFHILFEFCNTQSPAETKKKHTNYSLKTFSSRQPVTLRTFNIIKLWFTEFACRFVFAFDSAQTYMRFDVEKNTHTLFCKVPLVGITFLCAEPCSYKYQHFFFVAWHSVNFKLFFVASLSFSNWTTSIILYVCVCELFWSGLQSCPSIFNSEWKK